MQAYTLRCGLPHSDIHGSKGARPSPQLFAACHVLHRLLAPRHPPDALFNASFHALHYPCPENGPDPENRRRLPDDGRHPISRIRSPTSDVPSPGSQLFKDQCRIHMSPKLPPTARSTALACGQPPDRSRCSRIKTNPRSASLVNPRPKPATPVPFSGTGRPVMASGLDSPRKSSSTMSMNVLSEDRRQRTGIRRRRRPISFSHF